MAIYELCTDVYTDLLYSGNKINVMVQEEYTRVMMETDDRVFTVLLTSLWSELSCRCSACCSERSFRLHLAFSLLLDLSKDNEFASGSASVGFCTLLSL